MNGYVPSIVKISVPISRAEVVTFAAASTPYYALCRGGRKVMPRSLARGLRRVGKQVDAYAQWMQRVSKR